jgi:pilus assembly protein CpaB
MSRSFGGIHPDDKKDKLKVVLVISLVLACTAAAVGLILISSEPTPATAKTVVVEKEAEIRMVDVLIPIRNIEAGVALEPSMFRREPRPQVGVSSRVIQDFERIKGHFARSLIIPGQPLHEDYITNVKPASVITPRIPEGFRAVTIRVDARSSVEGWARPGSRVDVHWSSIIRGEQAVTTIVENAEVLSAERQVDSNYAAGSAVPSTVTLLVSADDSKRIQLASNTGSLSLSLRGDYDTGKGSRSGSLTVRDLLGQAPAAKTESTCQGTMRIGAEEFCVRPGGKLEKLGATN